MSAEAATTSVEPTLHVYKPVKSRVKVRELWTTLPVARMIGLRDVRAKYKQAALGPLWLLIAPLGMLAAITIAFSGVTDVNTGGVPYVLFALVGLTVWTFVQLSAALGSGAMVSNGGLVRRSPLPRVALVTGALLGNLPPVAVMFLVALVGTFASRGLPLQALLLPVFVAWLVVFTLAVAMVLAALAARFRDTVAIMPLILQAGIFVSPVGYSMEGAPKNIHTLLSLNPISGLIEVWRWSILDTPNPQWDVAGIAVVWTVVLSFVAWRTFTRLEVNVADYV
jgi:ABC-type polysaccharide/polyol phosphate export permease